MKVASDFQTEKIIDTFLDKSQELIPNDWQFEETNIKNVFLFRIGNNYIKIRSNGKKSNIDFINMKGYGKISMFFILQECINNGIEIITLEAESQGFGEKNIEELVSFYSHFGFEIKEKKGNKILMENIIRKNILFLLSFLENSIQK